jgi:hypothetical protein
MSKLKEYPERGIMKRHSMVRGTLFYSLLFLGIEVIVLGIVSLFTHDGRTASLLEMSAGGLCA